MSWADKRISLPSFLHGGGLVGGTPSNSQDPDNDPLDQSGSWTKSNNNTGFSARDITKNLVLTALLRKLKTNKMKWFVLYGDEPGDPTRPAHLEYHDDERKWKAGFPPKRDIVLNKCLNICRKQDSRDSKNKKVIALYTLDDCVGIVYESEDELRIWLDLLLSHQQGRNSNGKIPKPNYEHMWQVKVRNFQPENKSSLFTMTGPHRMCVTGDDVKFFPIGSGEPIVFPVDCIRNCGTINRIFRLETGRSSISGPGLVIIECEDKEIANNMNVRVLASMRESETVRYGLNPGPRQTSQYNQSTRHNDRPRSESWSNHDKPALPSSAPNISTSKFAGLIKDSSLSKVGISSSTSSSNNMRYRTTSEGAHFDLHKARRPLISSSPNSPGPGSFFCSSESAGSSNSIEDDSDIKHGASMTPDNHIADATIYEESSGESVVDPEGNRIKSSTSISSLAALINPNEDSHHNHHKRSLSLLSPNSDVMPNIDIETDKSHDNGNEDNNYIDMSSMTAAVNTSSTIGGPSDISSVTSSLHRLSLGHSLELTSPTSSSVNSIGGSVTTVNNTSSYNNESDYHLMSPVVQTVTSPLLVPTAATTTTMSNDNNGSIISVNNNEDDDFDYCSRRGIGRMDIPLSSTTDVSNSSSYVTMSPVNVDVDKLKSIEEEDHPPLPVVTSRSLIEERFGTPVKIRQHHHYHHHHHHRNSFCSSTDETPRWSPGPPSSSDPFHSSLPSETELCIDPESNYVPLNFAAAAAVAAERRRISPSSSCSVISAGTPSSADQLLHHPEKGISQIIRESDDLEDLLPPTTTTTTYPQFRGSTRAYSVGSRPPPLPPPTTGQDKAPAPLPPLPNKTRNGSRFIDIPFKGSSSWINKHSPSGSSSGQSPSSNLVSRIDSWFRHRAGSVPSRPTFFERKRHRTQSEGEKEDEH